MLRFQARTAAESLSATPRPSHQRDGFFVAQYVTRKPVSERTYQRCSAHRKNGERCKLPPIRGARVCGAHGGRAPQVRKAAAERLAEMVDPLLSELFRIAQSGENDAVRLAAVKDALDRAGYKPRDKVDVNVQTVKTIDRDAWDSV